MPIYEYACSACGHAFEEWQKMSDPPVRVCPKCKKKKVERLISATAFQLKGGGWYADLYSSSKPGSSGGDGGKDSGSSKNDKSDKRESKGDAKADSAKASGGGSQKDSAKGSAKESSSTPKKPETRAA